LAAWASAVRSSAEAGPPTAPASRPPAARRAGAQQVVEDHLADGDLARAAVAHHPRPAR
jgi:hypothetical protein